jgi:hypothetical protein
LYGRRVPDVIRPREARWDAAVSKQTNANSI